MKDVSSNSGLFMSSAAKDIFQKEDRRVFIDFFGFDKLHTKMLIGQLELSLVQLMQ